MASITINPLDGNNIINAADAAAGVTFTGTETGLDGQQLLFAFVGARNSPSDFQDIAGFNLGDDFVPVTANNGTWSYTLPSEVATKLLDSVGGPPYSVEIIDVQNNQIVASAQENVIVSEGNTQPVITVNPINNGTDIITPTNALQGITVSGTQTGFDGQTVTIDIGTLNSGPGTPPAATQFETTVTAQNGMWSATIPADAVLALPVDTAGYNIEASVHVPNGTGTDATFFADRNLQSERTITLGNGAHDTVDAGRSSHDKLTLGNGAHDTVDANAGSYDTISLGNGARDTVSANGSSYDTITLGDGAHDTVDASGSSHDTITLGNDIGEMTTYTYILFSNPLSTNLTHALGINNLGQIVGRYDYEAKNADGFLYSGGTFTSIAVPGAEITEAWGINDTGQIVGDYEDSTLSIQGYLYSDGKFTNIEFPGATSTSARGINDAGQIAGYYEIGDNDIPHGFLYADGIYTQISVPGSAFTSVEGINNEGQVCGWYDIITGTTGGQNLYARYGFIYNTNNGTDAGEIVGFYPNGSFLAVPNPTKTGGNGNDSVTAGSDSTIKLGNGNDTVTAGSDSNIAVGNGNNTVSAGSNSTVTLGRQQHGARGRKRQDHRWKRAEPTGRSTGRRLDGWKRSGRFRLQCGFRQQHHHGLQYVS
jgi:probable HAF family extracellular repeat protein